jgi:Major royal jelly protein
MPRWKRGVPATLAWVQFPNESKSPLLNPYPNLAFNTEGNCDGLTSVFRVMVDECDRLWVLDTGLVNTFEQAQQICPPKVMAFDLKTDALIYSLNIPQVRKFELYTILGMFL